MARTPVPTKHSKIVLAEPITDEEANRANDTSPEGGALDYGEGAIDRDLAVSMGLDPDAFDDDAPTFDDLINEPEDDEDDDSALLYDELDDPRARYLAEAGYDPQFVPPWSPVPTAVGKKWIEKNPDAQIDIVFPTVYEEDRTAKLKDLGTANALGSISHQRMSEQMAKELGFEQYNYVEEMQQVKVDAKTLGPTVVGVADDLASTVLGIPVQPGGKFAPRSTRSPGPGGGSSGPQPIGAPAPGIASERPKGSAQDIGTTKHGDAPDPYDQPKRKDLSDPETTKFRAQQRDRNTLESFSPRVKRIVRNAHGLITEIVDEPLREVTKPSDATTAR